MFNDIQYSISSFLCNECGHSAKSKISLKTHARKHDTRKFSCDICDKIVIGYNNYNGHKATHKELSCPICWKMIPKNSLTSHKAICSAKAKAEIKCDECEFFSSNNRSLVFYNSKRARMTPPINRIRSPNVSPASSPIELSFSI